MRVLFGVIWSIRCSFSDIVRSYLMKKRVFQVIQSYPWPQRQEESKLSVRNENVVHTKFKQLRHNASRKNPRRLAKIGQNQPLWTKWLISHESSFVRTIPEKSLRVRMRWSVWRGLFQNPKHDHYCVIARTKRPSTSIFLPVFPSISRVCEKRKKVLSQIPRSLEFRRHIFCVKTTYILDR